MARDMLVESIHGFPQHQLLIQLAQQLSQAQSQLQQQPQQQQSSSDQVESQHLFNQHLYLKAQQQQQQQQQQASYPMCDSSASYSPSFSVSRRSSVDIK